MWSLEGWDSVRTRSEVFLRHDHTTFEFKYINKNEMTGMLMQTQYYKPTKNSMSK